jgi:amidase
MNLIINKNLMKRRYFVKSTILGGGAVALSPLSACTAKVKKEEKETGLRPFDLDEVTISQLTQKMENKELSAEEITKKYIDRIREIDLNGPALKAVIELNPDAEAIARQSDLDRVAGKIHGPLHGIPVLIKDNIDSSDKMQTTAGSLALSGFYAPKDAFIVRKLREAGAVLLGKTNLSEWANIRSTRSSSGWSGRGGQVKNPYDPTRSPCGSSSGSAVAVAANLCTIAIGTETDGSIVCPSGINGITGIKPTIGLWSRHGIIPISHSQDTPGPMARTVQDAAILLGALKGFNQDDPATSAIPAESPVDYTSFLDKNGLKGARIGIIRDFMGFHSDVDLLMESTFGSMRELGAQLIEVKCAENRSKWSAAEELVLQYELKADMNKYLSERPASKVKSLKDLIEFNNLHINEEMKWFGQEFFLMAEKKGDLSENEYKEALALSKKLTRTTIDNTLKDNNLSALITPTNAPSWKIDLVNGDHFIGGTSDLAAISGYPSITVPAGEIHGLPIGISFIGRAWDEATLIKLAYSFEQGTMKRFKPGFMAI